MPDLQDSGAERRVHDIMKFKSAKKGLDEESVWRSLKERKNYHTARMSNKAKNGEVSPSAYNIEILYIS